MPSHAGDSPATSQQATSDSTAESNSAASAKTPADETQPAEILTYTGQVTDKLTGKPISGATVTVRRRIEAPYERRVIEEPKYTTDTAGKYTFTIQVRRRPQHLGGRLR